MNTQSIRAGIQSFRGWLNRYASRFVFFGALAVIITLIVHGTNSDDAKKRKREQEQLADTKAAVGAIVTIAAFTAYHAAAESNLSSNDRALFNSTGDQLITLGAKIIQQVNQLETNTTARDIVAADRRLKHL